MTGLAEGHEVIFSMGAAAINGENVMNFIGGDETTGLKALFAERVLGNVSVTNLPPAITVDLVVIRRALVFVIATAGGGLVIGAVALGGKLGAAGVAAGMWGFGWHMAPPSEGDQVK